MTEQQLYQALVDLCQQFGFTTGHTYDLLHRVVDSIQRDTE